MCFKVPEALTSLAMKTFEKIVKEELLTTVQADLDPLQFAYKSGWAVDDAISTLLNISLSHLEGAKTMVQLLFIDFSSDFNCIQLHILAQRLKIHNINPGLICWLLDFLTDRSQHLKVNGVLWNVLLSSTGSLKGCVFITSFICFIYKCLSEPVRRTPTMASNFVQWCESSFLDINVTKTKEMIADFGKNPAVISPVTINDQPVGMLTNTGILAPWSRTNSHSSHRCARELIRDNFFFYCTLWNFNVDYTFMKMFYSCLMESVLTFSLVCWYRFLSQRNKNRLQEIVNVCSKVAGVSLNNLRDVYKIRTLRKARSILAGSSHPLHDYFVLLPFSRRYGVLRARTNRLKPAFVLVATGILNNSG